jgi:hypothetical protein
MHKGIRRTKLKTVMFYVFCCPNGLFKSVFSYYTFVQVYVQSVPYKMQTSNANNLFNFYSYFFKDTENVINSV